MNYTDTCGVSIEGVASDAAVRDVIRISQGVFFSVTNNGWNRGFVNLKRPSIIEQYFH